MSNDLIQKNAELGRFLFCERYTLQPVKNALYIAEGQDLKRGAVVDVNGVLVGTNSLMPYAVLENDCDTRSKGAFASVFVKGEFNFDKLFFADGLSKNDLDNIVYNGSGTGLVFKPYDYEADFSSAMVPAGTSEENPIMNAIEIEELIYANKEISQNTIRFSFGNLSFSPIGLGAHNGTWNKLETTFANIWDYSVTGTSMASEFASSSNDVAAPFADEVNNPTKVLKIDFGTIEDASRLFMRCSGIVALPKKMDITGLTTLYLAFTKMFNCSKWPEELDFSNQTLSTGFQGLFQQCTSMTKSPRIILSESQTSATFAYSGCINLKEIDIDLTNCTAASGVFVDCISLFRANVVSTAQVKDISGIFSGCKSLKEIEGLDISSATNTSGMFMMEWKTLANTYVKRNDGTIQNFYGDIVHANHLDSIENDFDYVLNQSNPATNISEMYSNCNGIKSIPDLTFSAANNTTSLFEGCENVEFGMLRLYNKLVALNVTNHSNTFKNCGINTDNGRAERTLIPKSWGGDAEG